MIFRSHKTHSRRKGAREGTAGAAACLLDQGNISQRPEDRIHRIIDRKDEAARQLAFRKTGIDEGWGVRQEIERLHHVAKSVADFSDFRRSCAPALGTCHFPSCAEKHLLRCFEGLTRPVCEQDSLAKNFSGNIAQLGVF
jgi:hypothetical protein